MYNIRNMTNMTNMTNMHDMMNMSNILNIRIPFAYAHPLQNIHPPPFYITNITNMQGICNKYTPPFLYSKAECGDKKHMLNMLICKICRITTSVKVCFCDFSRILLTAPPLVLCAGLRNSDAVDMIGLLTAYRFDLFSSGNALHAVQRRPSLRLCYS